MATWDVTRNIYISNVQIMDTARETLITIKNALVVKGWILRGSSRGDVAAEYDMLARAAAGSATDYWSSPSNFGRYAWLVLRHPTNGGELLLWMDSSSAYMSLYWSPTTLYTNDGAITAQVPPANPGDQKVCIQSGYNIIAWTTDAYLQLAITDDGESFIAFIKSGASNKMAWLFTKLEDSHTGDTKAYWQHFRGYSGSWDESIFNSWAYSACPYYGGTVRATPTWFYAVSTGTSDANPMTDLPPDPISGEQKMLEVPVYHWDPSVRQFRGTLPNVYRVSGVLADGDRLSAGAYVVIGDYAVPWGSAVDVLMG